MDSSNHFPIIRSPGKELQGPRPTPLNLHLHRDSHKIKKPPHPPPQSQPRPPVIIYTVSPKVIHTSPSGFMNLVQRLTGSSSSTSNPFNNDCGGFISPAARDGMADKINRWPEGTSKICDGIFQDRIDIGCGGLEGAKYMFPGILSPGPASLPTISPSFFAATSDPNSISHFFYDLSPARNGNGNSLMASPQQSFDSPHLDSPCVDLFNNFNDF